MQVGVHGQPPHQRFPEKVVQAKCPLRRSHVGDKERASFDLVQQACGIGSARDGGRLGRGHLRKDRDLQQETAQVFGKPVNDLGREEVEHRSVDLPRDPS